MENVAMNNPKDEHILNKDDSITNKDGNSYLEKGEQPTDQTKPEEMQAPPVIPDNGNAELEPAPEEKPSKKDTEPKKYAL